MAAQYGDRATARSTSDMLALRPPSATLVLGKRRRPDTGLAASAAGDPGDAYFYMGEYQIAGGDLPMAAQQLQLALATPNLSQVQRARFQARLDEVREFLQNSRLRRVSNTQ